MRREFISCRGAINHIKTSIDYVYIFLKEEEDFLKVMEEVEHYISLWRKQLKKGVIK